MRFSGLRLWVLALVLASSSGAWAQQRSKPRRDGGGQGQDAERAKKESEAKRAALLAAGRWLEIFDTGNFGKAFECMAPGLTQAIDMEQWEAATGAIRSPLGRVTARQPAGAHYFESEPVEIVAQLASTVRVFQDRRIQLPYREWILLQCQARFENHRGVMIETVQLVKDDDGQWKVLGFMLREPR